jgi:hypothetical protein
MEKANSNGSVVEHNAMSQLSWDRDAIGYLDLEKRHQCTAGRKLGGGGMIAVATNRLNYAGEIPPAKRAKGATEGAPDRTLRCCRGQSDSARNW